MSGFCYLAQSRNAVQILSVPLEHFVELGRSFLRDPGDAGVELVWLWNTARCGGTIFVQMAERLPDTVCMSEPDFLYTAVQTAVRQVGG